MKVKASYITGKLVEHTGGISFCSDGDPYVSRIVLDPSDMSVMLVSDDGDEPVYVFTGEHAPEGMDCILTGDMDIKRAYALIDRMFRELDEWEVSLARSAAESRGVQDLLDLSRKILVNPMTVYDNSMRLMGFANMSEEQIRGYYVNISGRWYISEDTWGESRSTDIPLIQKNPDHPIVFHDRNFDIDVTECPVRYDGQMIGFITVPHVFEEMYVCHYELIETLSRYLGYAMWQELRRENIYGPERVFPYDIILDRNTDPLLAEHFMNIFGWKNGERYQIAVMENRGGNDSSPAVPSVLSGYLSASINGRTVVILHGRTIQASSPDEKAIRIYLEKETVAMGVSNVFDDLTESAEHYLQALYICGASSSGIHFYEGHMYEHMLSEYLRDHDRAAGIHPFVRKLEKTDPSGVLRRTLLEYLLSDRKYTECAQALHIQKPSLKYRLDKIRDMDPAGTYLNKELRLDILLSLRMSLEQ